MFFSHSQSPHQSVQINQTGILYKTRLVKKCGCLGERIVDHVLEAGLSLGAQITTAPEKEKVDFWPPLPYQWLVVVKPLIIEILDHLRWEFWFLWCMFFCFLLAQFLSGCAYLASKGGCLRILRKQVSLVVDSSQSTNSRVAKYTFNPRWWL